MGYVANKFLLCAASCLSAKLLQAGASPPSHHLGDVDKGTCGKRGNGSEGKRGRKRERAVESIRSQPKGERETTRHYCTHAGNWNSYNSGEVPPRNMPFRNV